MSFATVDEAVRYARIQNPTDNDLATVADFIAAAEEQLTSKVGPLEPTQVVERLEAVGGDSLVLTTTPVISLTSLTPLMVGMIQVQVSQLDLDPGSGVVTRTDYLPLWGLWRITYQAGFASLPTTIKLAGLDLILHWWRQSQSHSSATYGESAVTDFSDLPNAVLNKLRPYLTPMVR